MSMRGRICCSHMLKAEAEYRSKMNFFRAGRFSFVGSQGRSGTSVGGNCQRGHEQGWVPSWPMPVFVHLVTGFVKTDCIVDPKSLSTNPNATHASSDRYIPLMEHEM